MSSLALFEAAPVSRDFVREAAQGSATDKRKMVSLSRKLLFIDELSRENLDFMESQNNETNSEDGRF